MNTLESVQNEFGTCVYCNRCQPCPAGIDIGLVNKYYDRALAGDEFAAQQYAKLPTNAADCMHCNHCVKHCPFGVDQSRKMDAIYRYFKEK